MEELEETETLLVYNIFKLLVKEPTSRGSFLGNLDVRDWGCLVSWASDNLLEDKIMPVEEWLEVSFYLMKERWGSDMDWLEKQPLSKIMTMINIVKRHGERVKKSYDTKK